MSIMTQHNINNITQQFNMHERHKAKKKKKVLSQSSRAHSFFFAHLFVLKWQIHFFLSVFFFLLFCQKLVIFLVCIIVSCVLDSIRGVKQTKRNKHHIHWCYHFYTSYFSTWFISKKEKRKKRGGEPHSASVFENLESFETEHFLSLSWRKTLKKNIILKSVKRVARSFTILLITAHTLNINEAIIPYGWQSKLSAPLGFRSTCSNYIKISTYSFFVK